MQLDEGRRALPSALLWRHDPRSRCTGVAKTVHLAGTATTASGRQEPGGSIQDSIDDMLGDMSARRGAPIL